MSLFLRNSPAEVLRQLLINLEYGNVAVSSGLWTTYVNNEPDAPDNAITVYDTAGYDDGRSMLDGELYRHRGCQIRVRSKDHPTGWQKLETIRVGLAEGVYDATVYVGDNAYTVHACTQIRAVLSLGKENPQSKRSIFTLNLALVIKAESPGTGT